MQSWWRKQGMSGKTGENILGIWSQWRGNWGCLGKEKKIFGNAELVETGDIQDNREKAFWKCGASGENWRCLRMLFLWFFRHPQFPPDPPQSPLFSLPALHFQNVFSLLSWISLVSISSTFPEYIFFFSQTSPVSLPLASHSQNVFSCFLRHPLFPPPALHFQNAFSLFPWISLVSTSSTFSEYFFPFFQTFPVPPTGSTLSECFFSLFRASGWRAKWWGCEGKCGKCEPRSYRDAKQWKTEKWA